MYSVINRKRQRWDRERKKREREWERKRNREEEFKTSRQKTRGKGATLREERELNEHGVCYLFHIDRPRNTIFLLLNFFCLLPFHPLWGEQTHTHTLSLSLKHTHTHTHTHPGRERHSIFCRLCSPTLFYPT